ncbi:MAG: methyltransferase domain-containing protein [Planctomycetes bacterium]|nr:methyltransferase domain-containing protein [Planctomycetota bacterium]
MSNRARRDAGEPDEYVLGTDAEELRRLRFQHFVWTEQLHALCARAGFRDGDAALDLGCGPGFTSFELARIVGPRGQVLACDVSARFLRALESQRDRDGLSWVATRLGGIEGLDVEPASFDRAYSRWLFSWLPDSLEPFRRVHRALRPGATFALHEYLDWGAMTVVPRSEVFDHAVAACVRAWPRLGATIDIARDVPRLAAATGFVVDDFQPIARVGTVGSLEWRWPGEFLAVWLRKLAAQGLFDTADCDAFDDEWRRLTAAGDSRLVTPTMAGIVLRKPPQPRARRVSARAVQRRARPASKTRDVRPIRRRGVPALPRDR